MRHNLFSHPTEINVIFENNEVKLENILESQKIIDILEDIDYDTKQIKEVLKKNLDNNTYKILKKYLHDNSYLKTTWS
jgi:arginine decarboxylase